MQPSNWVYLFGLITMAPCDPPPKKNPYACTVAHLWPSQVKGCATCINSNDGGKIGPNRNTFCRPRPKPVDLLL